MARITTLYIIGAICCVSLWALQRALKSKTLNFPNAPIEIQQSKVTLMETYSTMPQAVVPGATTQHKGVRYANRAGLLPSTFVINGEVLCKNTSTQMVEALALTVVLLDAFHQPVRLPGQLDTSVIQVMEQVPKRTSTRITWEQSLTSSEVYEVAIVITRVRFADGSVWLGPKEELIDIF